MRQRRGRPSGESGAVTAEQVAVLVVLAALIATI